MRPILSKPIVALMLCAVAGTVAAQQSQQSSAGSSAPPVAGSVRLGADVHELQLIAEGWRASKLIRSAVYNDEDQRIGRIEDMIVAPDGMLSVAIIEVGGFLGIGQHRVAVPVDQFSDVAPPKIVLPGATKDALKQMPEFKYAKDERQASRR